MVSVIVPLYNAEKHIEKCIRSILVQTYKNIELIIINDGSTDGSEEKVKAFLSDSRVKYLSQKNSGPAKARNRGVQEALGDYLYFVDSDDSIEEDTIEKMMALIENGADMVYSSIKRDYGNGKYEICPLELCENTYYNGAEIVEKIFGMKIRGYSCGILYKKEIWVKNNIAYADRKFIEDLIVVVKYASLCNKVCYIDKPFYNYYQHEDSLTHTSDYKIISDYASATAEVIEYAKSENINENDINAFEVHTFLETAHELYCVDSDKVSEMLKDERFNKWNISFIKTLRNKKLNVREKLKYFVIKSGLYYPAKYLYRIVSHR